MSDIARLKRLMERAEKGETLTIGFLGGSITQGSLAGTHENTYAYRVFTWWKNRFPKAKFRYVNGGIGGTSSHFGVARAHRDLLMYRPDFVVIDFSVNDELKEEAFFKESFEGVIRKVYDSETRPATVARLVLDGDCSHPMILDGNFDEDWGDCLYLQPIMHHGNRQKHRIDIEIIKADDGLETEFYLMSLIYS